MKMNVFPRMLAGTALALALVLGQVASAWGQDGDEGGAPIPLNEYGTPDMDQIDLTLSGDYSEQVTLIEDVPLVGDVGINLSYDLYSDNYGNTWVVPDAFTVIYTAMFPQDTPEGLANHHTDPWSYGSALMGIVDACGGLEAMGIDVGGATISLNTEEGLVQFFADLGNDLWNMEIDHLAFMWDMMNTLDGVESLPLWQMSWVYTDDPFDATDDPTGTPEPTVTGTPRPTATPTPAPRARHAPRARPCRRRSVARLRRSRSRHLTR